MKKDILKGNNCFSHGEYLLKLPLTVKIRFGKLEKDQAEIRSISIEDEAGGEIWIHGEPIYVSKGIVDYSEVAVIIPEKFKVSSQ